jgi:pullulanase
VVVIEGISIVNKQTFYSNRCVKAVLPLIIFVVMACGRAGAAEKLVLYLPPQPQGGVIATVEVTPPPGNAGRKIFAGLKRDGRIVARGETQVPSNGNATVSMQTMEAAQTLADGECELWLTINRDGLESCYPSYGDLFVHEKWNLQKASSAKTLADPSVWQERKLSKAENLITVHYHRYDEDYDNVGVWTWDAHDKRTPEQNEIFEVGRDDYGPVLQFDRGDYGEKGDSDKIGVLPRLAGDWNRKDGDDKFWTPDMGPDVYLVGGENRIWAKVPDISPRVVSASIDASNRIVLGISRLVGPSDVTPLKITITDDQKGKQTPTATRLLSNNGRGTANDVELTLSAPLDIVQRAYEVKVDGFGGNVRALPRAILADTNLFYDGAAVLGATYTHEGTTFRVFAPTARAVQVVIYDQATSGKGRAVHAMQAKGKGIWEGKVAGDLVGKFYLYKPEGDGFTPGQEVLDIYCINAVDSSARARITDLSKTNPPGWEKAKAGPALDSPVDMVVYEMHVRDFTIAKNSGVEHKGKYLGFTEAGTHLPGDAAIKTGLDDLTELGVTHVQLLPVQDFENDESSTNYNWGYVTSAYNSPEGWYATDINNESRIRELKELIAALHEHGIGVILDVVYNHTANSASFNALVPHYYYRYQPDGRLCNGSGCGNDFCTEAPMARKYILDSLKYWTQEYGVDGYRFDIMALIDLDTMKEVEKELRAINPHIVLYGEAWGGGTMRPPLKPTNKENVRGTHLGGFNDNLRDAFVGYHFDNHKSAFIQSGSGINNVKHAIEGNWRDWAPTPAQAINFLSCHDNLVVWDKLKLSKPGATEAEMKEMMKLGYLMLLTSQGVPFLHGGEEFARTKFGNDNSYNAPDNINEVDWSLKKKNYDLFTYTRDLIALRKAHPVFRLRSREQIAAWLKFHDTSNPGTVMYTIDPGSLPGETWAHACVIANSDDAKSYDFGLPAGPWHVALDADGAVKGERVVEGTVRVRYKSGMVLYQQ